MDFVTFQWYFPYDDDGGFSVYNILLISMQIWICIQVSFLEFRQYLTLCNVGMRQCRTTTDIY